jgi:hypothetical protein
MFKLLGKLYPELEEDLIDMELFKIFIVVDFIFAMCMVIALSESIYKGILFIFSYEWSGVFNG